MIDDEPLLNGDLAAKPDKRSEVVNYEMHPLAAEHIENLIMHFATTLVVQAKTLAYQRNDDNVTQNHVDEALSIIQQERMQKPWRTWFGVFGGVLVGVFLSGFLNELSAGTRPVWLAIYVAFGFLGLVLMLGLGR
jgi:F0F1-type ATP synthase assembly protein I